jgi:hypothetical protein
MGNFFRVITWSRGNFKAISHILKMETVIFKKCFQVLFKTLVNVCVINVSYLDSFSETLILWHLLQLVPENVTKVLRKFGNHMQFVIAMPIRYIFILFSSFLSFSFPFLVMLLGLKDSYLCFLCHSQINLTVIVLRLIFLLNVNVSAGRSSLI